MINQETVWKLPRSEKFLTKEKRKKLVDAIPTKYYAWRNSLLIYPHLIKLVGKSTWTYGKLVYTIIDECNIHVGFTNSSHSLGYIGQWLFDKGEEWDELMPPLMSKIVGKQTGIPGKGYFRHPLGKIWMERESDIEGHWQAVDNYQGWDKVNIAWNQDQKKIIEKIRKIIDESVMA